MLTQARLKELYSYNPLTGHFTRVSRARGAVVGAIVGTVMNKGYIHIKIDGKFYLGHRLAWLYTHGGIPQFLDHINGIRDDNRLINLREATRSQNNANAKKGKANSSGFKGVYPHKDGKWGAQVGGGKNRKYLGLFATPEEAHAAYCKAADELFGEFSHHG